MAWALPSKPRTQASCSTQDSGQSPPRKPRAELMEGLLEPPLSCSGLKDNALACLHLEPGHHLPAFSQVQGQAASVL